MIEDLLLRDAVIRRDFRSFIAKVFHEINPSTVYQHNWHVEAIAEYLNACETGELRRLIINMPPRMLKSLCVSVAWPAWLLGHRPESRLLVASYAQELALQHSRDSRRVLGSGWFQSLFPGCVVVRGQDEKHRFVTNARGFRLATSVGASLIGEGGDILIVDDPMNPRQAMSRLAREHACHWFEQSFVTRLNDKKRGAIVLVMQRLHAEDLSGYLLEKGGWEHLCLPAIAERERVLAFGGFRCVREAGSCLHSEREDMAEMEVLKRDLGSYAFAAQYQQSPVVLDSGMVNMEWFQRYRVMPDAFNRVVMSWDTAIKSGARHDASACTVWGETGQGYYLLDTVVERLEYPFLRQKVTELADMWSPHAVLIEDKASGQMLLQELKRDGCLPLIGIQPHGDKVTRFAAVTSAVEAGRVWLPVSAPWLAEFESELSQFPYGRYDDQVDSFSQYLNWVLHGQRRGVASLRRL